MTANRAYLVNIYNFTEADIENLNNIECRYFIIVQKVDDDGIPLLQCYIYYKGSGKSFNGVKQDFGDILRVHIEPATQKPTASKMHCSRDGLVILEYGELPKRGRKRVKLQQEDINHNANPLKTKIVEDENHVCATNARQHYFLSAKDLLELPCVRFGKKRLYNRDDLQKAAGKKHGAVDPTEILKILKCNREERIAFRKANSEERREKRRVHLTALLSKYGLELRDDSKLCQGYINGTVKDKSPEWIVSRICQMKYLYDYCDMKSAFKAAKQLKTENPDIFVKETAERIALSKVGGTYPRQFPWLS